MKSTVNDLDITPLLRFLLQRNVLFSNLFLLSSRFLPPFFLLFFLNTRFHQSVYSPSTFSNFFPIYLSTPPQIFNCPTHITASPYTSPVIPSFCTPLLPPLVCQDCWRWTLFYFSLFIFILLFFSFSFHFSIFRTARVRVDWSRSHISHKLMAKSQDWSRD